MAKAKKAEEEIIKDEAVDAEAPVEAVEEIVEDKEAKTEKAEKPEKKAKKVSTSEKAKAAAIAKARDPLARRGKSYKKALGLIDREKLYEMAEAIELIKKTATTKFDSSVDIHVNLGIDPAQSDQLIRTSVVLPGGAAKTPRVAVIAAVKVAEADKSGGEEMIDAIEKGKLDFDILVTTPDMMPKLAKVAKVLGPKGLMPNPKSGTVTPDPTKAVKEIKGGKVELRNDKQGIVHQSIGRVSFSDAKLTDNLKTVMTTLQGAKPSGSKGTYILAVSLATSMGPGIKLDTQKLLSVLQK